MPYIALDQRKKYNKALNALKKAGFINKGELEYVVFAIMNIYMQKRKFCYTELHDTCYAVQHCSDEYRRRYLDVRENQARQSNGDIPFSQGEIEG